MTVNRTKDIEKEFSKTPGGNFFNFVDVSKLERLGITQFKPSVGDNAVRIVYPPDRPGFYGLEIFKHSNVGTNRKTFLCKRRMEIDGGNCPICDYANTLRKEDPQDARAKELGSSRRYLFFVVEVSNDDAIEKGIRWWDCPIGIYNEIKSRSKNRKRRGQEEGEDFKKFIDVSHPSEGRDVVFEQVKEGKRYSYEGVDLVEAEPIPSDWYEDLPEFSEILKMSSNEEMEEACLGEATPDEVEDEEDDREVEDDSSEEEVEEKDEPTSREEKEEKKSSGRTTSRRSINKKTEEKEAETTDKKARIRERIEQAKKARSGE